MNKYLDRISAVTITHYGRIIEYRDFVVESYQVFGDCGIDMYGEDGSNVTIYEGGELIKLSANKVCISYDGELVIYFDLLNDKGV